jgi:hypothetical protein
MKSFVKERHFWFYTRKATKSNRAVATLILFHYLDIIQAPISLQGISIRWPTLFRRYINCELLSPATLHPFGLKEGHKCFC